MTVPIRPLLDDEPLSSEPTDTPRLIERIRAGDVAAFEELYQRYWVGLYTFCFRYLHSVEDAEEVVQEVFFRIWRQRHEWRVSGKLDSYLYRAVRNGAFDRLQHSAIVLQWQQRVRLDVGAGGERAAASAHEALQAGELAAVVERVLAELPAKRRMVCMLRWIDGLTYAEIAARLGIAEKTVETQIGRGLKFMRARVAELL